MITNGKRCGGGAVRPFPSRGRSAADGETVVFRAPFSVVPSEHFSFFPGPQLAAVRLDEGLAPRGLP